MVRMLRDLNLPYGFVVTVPRVAADVQVSRMTRQTDGSSCGPVALAQLAAHHRFDKFLPGVNYLRVIAARRALSEMLCEAPGEPVHPTADDAARVAAMLLNSNLLRAQASV